jgi:hypothetical protein
MRALLVGGIGLVTIGLAVGTILVLRPGDATPAAIPPPIVPAVAGTIGVTIPAGFLLADTRSQRAVDDQGMHWDKAEGTNLPSLISPCGGPLPSDADVVGARQVALVRPQVLVKLERVAVYRDADAAHRAIAERRDALSRCANHSEPDGVHTVWHHEQLSIGDESIFVAGQRMRGDQGLPGHHRAILMRQGRTLVMFVDFGQARGLAERAEVAQYERDAATMADKLRTSPPPWN